jgi:UDP-glucose 4-epimerase
LDLLDPVFELGRSGEVRRSCLDVSHAREALGWRARRSLSDGLGRILDQLV